MLSQGNFKRIAQEDAKLTLKVANVGKVLEFGKIQPDRVIRLPLPELLGKLTKTPPFPIRECRICGTPVRA